MAEITKRTRLREFQAALAERLKVAASSTASTTHTRLGVRIGAKRWLVDLAEAGEIMAVPPITAVPLTLDWYRGLANMRGNLVSVIDLSLFHGGVPTPLDKDSRILAFNPKLQFNGAILVSRMMGLRNLSNLTEITPVDSNSLSAWIGSDFEDDDGEAWSQLRLEYLIKDESFLRVGRYM